MLWQPVKDWATAGDYPARMSYWLFMSSCTSKEREILRMLGIGAALSTIRASLGA